MSAFLVSIVLLVSFLPSIALAKNIDNIFKAELSHPEITKAVTAFENICLPFILHTSELTQESDRKHYQKILEASGFVFKESMRDRYRIYDGTEGQFKPKAISLRDLDLIIKGNTKGQFTVFNGVSNKAVQSVQTIVTQPGEILLPAGVDIPKYKTGLTELYMSQNDERFLGKLAWNPYESQKQPAKSCSIKYTAPTFSTLIVTDTVIQKDKDWFKKGLTNSWYQCSSQEEDKFLFTIDYRAETFSINVERVDTFVEQGKKSLCDFKWNGSSFKSSRLP